MNIHLIYPIYLLSVAGLTLIVVKSKLFINVRAYISQKHNDVLTAFIIQNGSAKRKGQGILWFLDSVLNCSMCFSLWAAIILLIVWYLKLFVVLYVLSAVPFVTLIVAIYEYLCRK